MKTRKIKNKFARNQLSTSAFFVCLIILGMAAMSSRHSPIGSEQKHPTSSVTKKLQDTMVPALASGTLPAENSAVRSSPQVPHARHEPQSMFDLAVLRKLEDPTAPLSAVCDKISKLDPRDLGQLNKKPHAERLDDSVLGRTLDPAFESVQPALRYALTQPSLKGVVANYDPRISLSDAYKALTGHREELEYILDQSYLLFMLSRSVEANPALASNPQVTGYCNIIESSLNEMKPVNFEKEKRAFSEWLAAVKVDPNSIGYDPGYKSDLDIELEETTFSYKVGWLKEVGAPL
jgi:hypothetical protein